VLVLDLGPQMDGVMVTAKRMDRDLPILLFLRWQSPGDISTQVAREALLALDQGLHLEPEARRIMCFRGLDMASDVVIPVFSTCRFREAVSRPSGSVELGLGLGKRLGVETEGQLGTHTVMEILAF
jgi:hypothetical protein